MKKSASRASGASSPASAAIFSGAWAVTAVLSLPSGHITACSLAFSGAVSR
jgi:hypothetical protein